MDNLISLKKLKNKVFLCGSNIPWILFSRDLVYFSSEMEEKMAKSMNEIQNAGGNVLRWWLHTNGNHSPSFINGKVSEITEYSISVVKKVLEMARQRNLLVIICLWSFDMFNDQGQDIPALKNLIEDPVFTFEYINNALLPILKAIDSNSSLLAVEIFNEPEGMTNTFGWTDYRTEMKFIQQTINLIAGAVHRSFPDILVSTSAWNMQSLTDISSFTNYYRDDRLIAAGGDPKGYLDFYQVHFYPEHYNETTSPFHHPYIHWGIAKPLLISEFSVESYSARAFTITKKVEKSFYYAINNGYAGCLTWNKNINEFSIVVKPAIETFMKKIEGGLKIQWTDE